jgi:hypothetical protein
MSKIALEGNPLGSGTFTIASPNSSSSFTLTLPTASGTVVTTGGAQTIEFAAGTAGAPSITTTGDTNTGIFFPAADTIAFAEGGAEAMRIDSAGNVGIGTSSPATLLHLAGVASPTIRIASSSGPYSYIESNTVGSLGFSADEGNTGASSNMNFRVDGTERMRITSSGNVGIGTTSPLGKVDITAAQNDVSTGSFTSPHLRLAASAVTDTNGFTGVAYSTSLSNNFGWTCGAQRTSDDASVGAFIWRFHNNSATGTERMRLTSSGEVLVGGTVSLNAAATVTDVTIQNTGRGQLNLFRNDTSIASTDVFGVVGFWGNDTTSNTPTTHAYLAAVASGTHAAGDNPTDLVFGCTNDNSEAVAEFARIGQAGADSRFFNVQQPTLANNGAVYIQARGGTAGTLNRVSTIGVYKHSGITNSCAYLTLQAEDGAENGLWTDNSDVLRISTVASNIGTTGGTVVGTQTSDERLKDISGPVSYGLNEVLAIEPIAFTMKDDPSIPKIGFSAQQVQPIVPEAVYDTKECIDGYTENEETKEQIANSDRTKLAMEYTQLIPVLVNAVKELKAELDEAKARIAALETGA